MVIYHHKHLLIFKDYWLRTRTRCVRYNGIVIINLLTKEIIRTTWFDGVIDNPIDAGDNTIHFNLIKRETGNVHLIKIKLNNI